MVKVEEILADIKARLDALALERDTILRLDPAAEYCGFSDRYLRKLAQAGAITYYRPNGKTIYFKRSDLDAYLTRNRVATKDEIELRAIEHVSRSGRKR